MKILNIIWGVLSKPFTHNLCDTCGYTKDKIFVTESYIEGGILQCQTCIDREQKILKNKNMDVIFHEVNNRKDFLSVDKQTAISAHGEIFNVGDLVAHEDSDAGNAHINYFELDEESNDVRAVTDKGWARICFIYKIK